MNFSSDFSNMSHELSKNSNELKYFVLLKLTYTNTFNRAKEIHYVF